MSKWIIGGISSIFPTLIPLLVLGISSMTAYYFYKTNENLKHTIERQSLIISDLRDVNEQVRGLYSNVHYRLNLEGLRVSESIIKVNSNSDDVMSMELPSEVLEVLNGSNLKESSKP